MSFDQVNASHLSTAVRVNRRTGQPELLHTWTKRHGLSPLPAAIGELLSVPLKERQPLPRSREESLDLCKKHGSGCHILVSDKQFQGLLISTASMRGAMPASPEFLGIDATYKLLDMRTPVYIIYNED
ncbi:hypothetical protein HPB47_002147 [Ixodes persulcatus]|uniref:Uncharacterized protein n=1 Tax=Ixodes persulcatus TaxID=34615 RepID=A0AC60PM12_IXOPE|nr:hypothetical protein HPB47_002147 [Ixodes persulcatus]